ncbi:MAG: hypothetical protein HRU69_10125 [Flammeovirgaceae bacterium]|nr:MAG: hypothetical protein HRU69_10125 [Flammeovirgaceae bacterium]
MAHVTPEVIDILRKTAEALRKSTAYQWGHMGLCNCGFLAQQITRLRKDEIHRMAMQRHGDWTEQLNDYCPASGLPMDELIATVLKFGFDIDDLKHLERLSGPSVKRNLPNARRNLSFNVKDDVICYLEAWADQLEAELITEINLPIPEPAVPV